MDLALHSPRPAWMRTCAKGSTMRSDLSPARLADLAAFCLAWQLASAQTYVLTTVDVPGASSTRITSINDEGQLLAFAGANFTPLVYQSGVYSPLPPAPGGGLLTPTGISDSGQITGSLNAGGFLLSGTTYTTFTVPGSSGSEANNISASGLVTGDYNSSGAPEQGYVYNPATSTFTSVSVPGAFATSAWGVDAAGDVTGWYVSASSGKNIGFLLHNGTYSSFQISGALDTLPQAMNSGGLIAGVSLSSDFSETAFVGSPSSGFQILNVAGSTGIVGQSINNFGQVSGFYMDAAGVDHGFIATPAWLPTRTTTSGAFAFNVGVTPNSEIFIDAGSVTSYQYQTGTGNPNFASVLLPIGIGDSLYSLALCNGTSLGTIAGGQAFTFSSGGVSCFDVGGIAPSAGLSPADPEAFVTGLTFTASGEFTGTMDPLTGSTSPAPEPAPWALLGVGLIGIALARLRRRAAP